MPDYVLPSDEGVQQMLAMVIGDDACVELGTESAVEGFSHVARFVDDEDVVVGLCLADLELSAALGAGLSMIPPAAVEDMVQEKALTRIAQDNLYEVMNMLSSLFMNDQTPHLRLTTVDVFEDTPEEIDDGEFSRVDYCIEAGKYGKGLLTFFST